MRMLSLFVAVLGSHGDVGYDMPGSIRLLLSPAASPPSKIDEAQEEAEFVRFEWLPSPPEGRELEDTDRFIDCRDISLAALEAQLRPLANVRSRLRRSNSSHQHSMLREASDV